MIRYFIPHDALVHMFYLTAGVLDLFVAVVILFTRKKAILYWAILWPLVTALARPLSGMPVYEFMIRIPNFLVPVVLNVYLGFVERKRVLG